MAVVGYRFGSICFCNIGGLYRYFYRECGFVFVRVFFLFAGISRAVFWAEGGCIFAELGLGNSYGLGFSMGVFHI